MYPTRNMHIVPLSKKVLLYPYYPAFLFLFIALCDTFFFNTSIQKILPKDIEQVFIYYALFELPHIIASLFIFGDKEYRTEYRPILYKNIFIVLPLIALSVVYIPKYFYIVYICYTLYHFTHQQFGIAKLYGIKKSRYISFLKYLFIIVGSLGVISTPGLLLPEILQTSILVTLLSVSVYFIVEKHNRKNIYLTLYILAFMSASFLFGFGYTFLALLSMRMVHDITAFMFYSSHNYNRKEDKESQSTNPIFSSKATRSIHPYILTPLLAISINLLYVYLVHASSLYFVAHTLFLSGYFFLGFLHYNLEGSLWKRDSLARNYIQIH